jgi:hypothetical protein
MRIIPVIVMYCLLHLTASVPAVAQDSVERAALVAQGDSPRVRLTADSIPLPDSTAVSKAPVDLGRFRLYGDSITSAPLFPYGNAVAGYISKHPQYRASEPSLRLRELERKPARKEWMFYLFSGLLLLLALLRLAFPKYMHDMFRVFFNTSMRQKQLRDQLIQDPLPSISLNVLFVVSGGLYLYFLLAPTTMSASYPAWAMLGGCMALIASVYLVKFIIIRSLGWIFGKGDASEGYLFVVFMVNKIAGMILLPFSILLAYANADTRGIWVTASYMALGILLLYRLVRGYGMVHKSLRINQLYFMLFVIAFEVIPILLLYKGLNTLF